MEALESAEKTLEEIKEAEEKLNRSKSEMVKTINELRHAAEVEGHLGETEEEEVPMTDNSLSDGDDSTFHTPGVKNKAPFSGHSFADLINVITQKTSDFQKGKLRFNVQDSATVSRVMSEIMIRYGRMERRLLVVQKDCEKERERNGLIREVYEKELGKREAELKEKEKELRSRREGETSEAVLARLGELIDRAQGLGNSVKGNREQTLDGAEREVRETEVGGFSSGTRSTGAIRKVAKKRPEINTDTSGDEGLARARGARDDEGDWETVRRKRTYAEAVFRERRGGPTNNENREGWKTPPRKEGERFELTIEKEGKKGQDLIREVKGLIKDSGVNAVRGLKEVREGRVIAAFVSNGERDKVREKLKENKEVRVGENGGINPKLKITGLEKGLTDEEILMALHGENAELWEGGEYGDCMNGARVLFRRPCRREGVENVVVELKGDTFRKLVRKERVTVSMMVYVVEEFADLAVCYRCSKFGHTGARCTEDRCCNRCGGSHEVRECTVKDEWDCPNCKKMGVARGDRFHSASDKRCPVYRRKLNQRMINTNYNG